MKKLFLLLFFIIQYSYTQTKLIAHKSHSGMNTTFHKAMATHSELHFSDFGMPTYEVTPLKKVKYVSDSIFIFTYTDNKKHKDFYLRGNDLAVIEKCLKNGFHALYPLRVTVEGFEIKNPNTYYENKYKQIINVYGRQKRLLKLDTIERVKEGNIILKRKKNTYLLKGYEIFEIKELREIKWLMSQLYNTKRTTFIGFTKPQKENSKTIITNEKPLSYLRGYYDSINRLIRKGKPYKSRNKVKQQLDTIQKVLKEEKKLKEKNLIPALEINNQPPFDFKPIYILLIGLISVIVGLTYKISKSKQIENI